MSQRFDCSDPAQLAEGLQEAQAALRRGQLQVMPTDTVYGIAAEAFDPVAVDLPLAAKGQGMPPRSWSARSARPSRCSRSSARSART